MKHHRVKLRTLGRKSRHKQLTAVANHMMRGCNEVYLHSVYNYGSAEQWTIRCCWKDIYLTWRKGHGFYLSRPICGYDSIDIQHNLLFFPAARASEIQLVDRHDDIGALFNGAQILYARILAILKTRKKP